MKQQHLAWPQPHRALPLLHRTFQPLRQTLTSPRQSATALLTVGAVIIGALPALALWGDNGKASTPEFPIGTVAFGAGPVMPDGGITYDMSVCKSPDISLCPQPGGQPVTLRIPGSLISEATALTDPPASPAIYEFALAGLSPQSVGVQYLISAVGQYGAFDDESGVEHWVTRHPDQGVPWDGVANSYTLLAYSTVQVYPATYPGDMQIESKLLRECGVAPALPDPLPASNGGSNVLVYDTTGALSTGSESAMATPGTVSDLGQSELPDMPSKQYWCVAVTPNAYPIELPEDGYYVNQFTAIGQGAAATLAPGATQPTCTDWQTLLDASGNPTPVTDTEQWWVQLIPPEYPEPDLLLQIDPTIIHISSLHSPGTPADPSFDIPSDTNPTTNTPNPYFSF